MTRIAIYDPPGCCSTGVCDPGLSDQMTQFATAIDALMKAGHDVARFNMGSEPGAFVENSTVKHALDIDGMECLPMVLLGEKIVSKGAYLNRTELSAKVGIEIPSAPAKNENQSKDAAASSCCD
ncbi:MAG: hypothetical protein CBB68_05600 [Rhodospirillaceae bacterium TMED8]|nr:arsenical resistance operon transcriptional repressor ArsD [Magnetovibrio sp.]OUT51467.1 MAG: hypothetical protein CBB68_05600 [Rhodospirillaceae bacterium TMED8]|tara:strand:- start:169 stop:540 length:372 start_codon:yes stop_codon:yes gene_type:complete